MRNALVNPHRSPRCFPLRWTARPPAPGTQGAFGAVRKHDIHTGVDLHCPEGTGVVSVEAGTVVAVVPFTGPEAESPWWHSTKAVLVEGPRQVLCYGEIEPVVQVGETVKPDQLIGRVVRVLKQDKGLPTAMLHFEAYNLGTRDPVWWRHGEPKPDNLQDPTPLLTSLLGIP